MSLNLNAARAANRNKRLDFTLSVPPRLMAPAVTKTQSVQTQSLIPSNALNSPNLQAKANPIKPAQAQVQMPPTTLNPPALEPITASTQEVKESQNILSMVCEKVINLFKSVFSCFGLFSQKVVLSPEQRENRLSMTDAEIAERLIKQMQYSNAQMAAESVKSFNYMNAPVADWPMHEERVGSLPVGICHAQGRRPTMEDEHLAVAFDLNIAGRQYPIQLFGVFDGHGGPLAAQFVRDNLQRKLEEALREFNTASLTDAGIWRALKMTPVRLNQDFKRQQGELADYNGTTATIAMILDNKLWTANVGDSRTVLDNHGLAVQLTEDAKPGDERYRKGIENRGGEVYSHGVMRINGDLAVARAIGDHRLNGAASARPKITVKPLSEIKNGSHLILCCDGIYDVSRTVDIVNAVHQNHNLTAGNLARNIVYSAYQAGSTDNLSALVVKIN
jgi:serine/threonine protein phosphatase PrpC